MMLEIAEILRMDLDSMWVVAEKEKGEEAGHSVCVEGNIHIEVTVFR